MKHTRSKPRFRLVPKRIVATAFAGLIPAWTIPLATLSCVPGFPCYGAGGRSLDPSCGPQDGGATDGDAAGENPDGGGGG